MTNICDGTGYLPRSMGWKLPDGTYTGMCISCQEFHPMTEVIPPSKPTYRREFRLAPHTPGDGPKDPDELRAGQGRHGKVVDG